MKKCTKCGKYKDESEFGKDNAKRDKKCSHCKECTREKSNKYYHNNKDSVSKKFKEKYKKNPEKYRSMSRNYGALHREDVAERSRRWRKEHPEKHKEVQENKLIRTGKQIRKAQNALSNAVAIGLIKRSTSCQNCGKTGCRIEGHHKDYGKPLDVIWLCGVCHKVEHGITKNDVSLLEARQPNSS